MYVCLPVSADVDDPAYRAAAEKFIDDLVRDAIRDLADAKVPEEKRAAALGKHPEPPDGEVSVEKARSLWIQRALQQTSYVSHMTKEMDDYSVETEWGLWSYERYRRMLDAEMTEVCRIYAEIELTDLPGSKGEEAQEWLTDAHGNVKREHERINMHIRRLGGAGEPGAPLQNPKKVYTLEQQEQRVEATARATGTPKGSQLAGKVDTGSGETGSSQRRGSTGPRTTSGTEVDLVDSTSESDTSDPGGMPQLFRGAAGLGACPSKLLRTLPHETGDEEAAWDAGELPAAESREESPESRQLQEARTGSSLTEMGGPENRPHA